MPSDIAEYNIKFDMFAKSNFQATYEVGRLMSTFRIAEDNLGEHARDFAESVARTVSDKTQRLIPARHRLALGQRRLETASGRLWTGFGVRREEFVDRDDRNGMKSTRADNIYIIRQMGGRVTVTLGTRIRYAYYVSEGRPLHHKGRFPYGFAVVAEQIADDGDPEIQQNLEYFQAKVVDDLNFGKKGRSKRSLSASINIRKRMRNELGQVI